MILTIDTKTIWIETSNATLKQLEIQARPLLSAVGILTWNVEAHKPGPNKTLTRKTLPKAEVCFCPI